MSDEQESRERSLELIRASHDFPGPFQVRVVHHPGAEVAILSTLRAALSHDDPIGATSSRRSRTGRFQSVAVTLHLASAEEVLEVYAVLRTIDGVITVL